jgi:type II secretory pathway component PulF
MEPPVETVEGWIFLSLAGIYLLASIAVVALAVYRGLQYAGFYDFMEGSCGSILGLLISAPLTVVLVILVLWPLLAVMIYAPPLWLICLFVVVEMFRKHRASRQYALLWLLTVAVERGMSLGPVLEAFAREARGAMARRARRLAALLAAGETLPAALDRVPHLLPTHTLPTIRAGYSAGNLAAALRRAATVPSAHDPVYLSLGGKVAYLILLPIFAMGLMTFIMLKILPAYDKIFEDFHTTLPLMTQRMIAAARVAANYWFIYDWLFVLLLLLLVYAALRYYGVVRWDLPGLERFGRRLDAAGVLDALALVARQRQPMPEAIAELARTYPRPCVRELLQSAARDVAAGGDWIEGLRRRGLLGRAEAAMLESAQRAGNLSWAMTETADSLRRRFAYRLQALAQTAFPFVVIVYGMIVGFIVIALFMPLIKLIVDLS